MQLDLIQELIKDTFRAISNGQEKIGFSPLHLFSESIMELGDESGNLIMTFMEPFHGVEDMDDETMNKYLAQSEELCTGIREAVCTELLSEPRGWTILKDDGLQLILCNECNDTIMIQTSDNHFHIFAHASGQY